MIRTGRLNSFNVWIICVRDARSRASAYGGSRQSGRTSSRRALATDTARPWKSHRRAHCRKVPAKLMFRIQRAWRKRCEPTCAPGLMPTKLTLTWNREVRPYGEKAMAFVLDQRPSPRNAIFCRLADADAAAAEFLDARRARRMFPGGRIRHRRIRPLALDLHGAPAA